jgi:hypothetical protein
MLEGLGVQESAGCKSQSKMAGATVGGRSCPARPKRRDRPGVGTGQKLTTKEKSLGGKQVPLLREIPVNKQSSDGWWRLAPRESCCC